MIGFALGRLTSLWHPRGAGKLWQEWLIEFELFFATLIAATVMAKIEGRSVGTYGLPRSGAFGKNFWVGTLWGFAWLTVLMVALRLTHAFYFGGLAIHGVRVLRFAAFYALLFLTVGLFEELVVRGYPLFTLTHGMGFWPAAILLSIIFGAMHYSNSGEGWVGLLGAGLIGFFLCLTVRRTGTLWFAVGFHASWDWGESYFYSVPDSGGISPGHLLNSSFHGSHWLTGGSVGPEGSLLVFVVIGLMCTAFDRVYPDAKQSAAN
jgi:membrane protease YdiL (CAAX protease family)